MKLLEDKIKTSGKILDGGVLKVDSFVNHQIDVPFMCELGKAFFRLYKKDNITKILTIEASGIGIACLTAQYFGVPVVFAKKSQTANLSGEFYTSGVDSFTHKKHYDILVSKDYISADDRVLIIDDFLAMGSALEGLIDIVKSANATLVGAGIVIEKAFQPGGDKLRDKGIRIESLARVKSMSAPDHIEFV